MAVFGSLDAFRAQGCTQRNAETPRLLLRAPDGCLKGTFYRKATCRGRMPRRRAVFALADTASVTVDLNAATRAAHAAWPAILHGHKVGRGTAMLAANTIHDGLGSA